MERRFRGLAKLVDVFKTDEILKILQFTLWNSWFLQNDNLKLRQEELISKGCVCIGDLYDESMNILTYNNFCTQFVQINFLDYASLVMSIPTTWKRIISAVDERPVAGVPELFYQIIQNPKTCRFAYKYFIESLPVTKPHELKWIDKGIRIRDEEWRAFNILPFKCTFSTKLQAFQYKITHRILGTASFKKLCNIVEDDSCTFCSNEQETLKHLFVECPEVQIFWENVRTWLNTYPIILNIADPIPILFGDTRSLLASHVLLSGKYYIFLCQIRKQRLCLTGFKHMLITEYKTEQYISKQSKRKTITFQDKWGPIEDLLTANL